MENPENIHSVFLKPQKKPQTSKDYFWISTKSSFSYIKTEIS